MVVAIAGFTAWQVVQVRDALTRVGADLTQAVDHLSEQRTAKATASIAAAQANAERAHRHSSGPVWAAAELLPWIGDDVTAVRTVSSVSDDLTTDTLPDLVGAVEEFSPEALAPRKGRIQLDPISRVAPTMRSAAKDLAVAHGRMKNVDTEDLLDALAAPVADLQEKLADAAALTSNAAVVAEVLPPMLGADGERDYLLAFQTNAEIRALGGMFGSYAHLRADDGRPEIVSQGKPGRLRDYEPSDIELTREEVDLYTRRVADHPQNASFLPDFPRAAQVISQVWEANGLEPLDGVLSMDPVALGYMLEATGPIELENGQRLTSENAADYLLNGVYLNVGDTGAQDALFDEVALKVFDKLMAGDFAPSALVDALVKAGDERRLMIWSAHEDEQSRFADKAVAGVLPTAESTTPEIGVYFNDSAADKLSYYLDYSVDVTPRSCGSSGSQAIDVEVTMTSTVPKGAKLTDSIIGPGLGEGVEVGTLRNSVYVYGPVAGALTSATLDGDEAPMQEATHQGRPVGVVTLDLAPGETRVLTASVRTGPGQDGTPRLVTTPASLTTGHGEIADSSC